MTTLSAANTLHSGRDPQTTLIRITEVMAIVGLARPTIYKLMQQAGSKAAASAAPDSQSAAGLSANAPMPSLDPRNRELMRSRERGER